MATELVRTQIQLSREQSERLRKLAAERHVSVAHLIRDGVDKLLAEQGEGDRQERIRRSLSAVGSFDSGLTDVSARHDDYVVEAFEHDLHRDLR